LGVGADISAEDLDIAGKTGCSRHRFLGKGRPD
jgi:hypothetical protein